jgi:predicted membrane protein
MQKENDMTHANRRALLGIFLVFVGVFFLLENMNLLPDLPYWLFTWPMILIVIGVFNLIAGNRQAAIILFAIGGFFLIKDIFYLDWRQWWPIVLIIIGVSFIFRQRAMKQLDDASPINDNYFDALNIFGGGNQKVLSENLQGGKITSIFGGSEVDLREAKVHKNATIEVFSLFGGGDIIVPKDWTVKTEVVAILGGFSDARTNLGGGDGPVVVIKGMVIFGGGEVKS